MASDLSSNMSASLLTNQSFDDHWSNIECAYTMPYDWTRFMIIVVFGMPFGTIGLVANVVLFCIFNQTKYRNSPTLYLAILALLDTAICTMYLLIFVVDAFVMYYQILEMAYIIWHHYAMPLFALSRIVQLASTYLVICASAERFCLVADIKFCKPLYSIQGRRVVISVIFLLAISLRAPSYWEYKVITYDNCTEPFKHLDFYPLLAQYYSYSVTYSFFIMQVIQVFVPFLLLVILNIAIVTTVRKRFLGSKERTDILENHDNNLSHAITSAAYKYRLKTATYTTVAIITSYLICNSFDLLVKTLEQLDNMSADDAKILTYMDETGTQPLSTMFYYLSTDVISILFTINSFLRPFICVSFDRQLRADLKHFLRRQSTRPRHLLAQSNLHVSRHKQLLSDRSAASSPAVANLLTSVTERMSKRRPLQFSASVDIPNGALAKPTSLRTLSHAHCWNPGYPVDPFIQYRSPAIGSRAHVHRSITEQSEINGIGEKSSRPLLQKQNSLGLQFKLTAYTDEEYL